MAQLIVLAEKKHDHVDRENLRRFVNFANGVMHNYTCQAKMSERDERTILEFVGTLKFLIERAPVP